VNGSPFSDINFSQLAATAVALFLLVTLPVFEHSEIEKRLDGIFLELHSVKLISMNCGNVICHQKTDNSVN
jgi:hypothetical protein